VLRLHPFSEGGFEKKEKKTHQRNCCRWFGEGRRCSVTAVAPLSRRHAASSPVDTAPPFLPLIISEDGTTFFQEREGVKSSFVLSVAAL